MFIRQEKRNQQARQRAINELTPKIYSAFAVSLHRNYGFGFTRILRALADTQMLWMDDISGGESIMDVCQRETGINMMSAITAENLGVDGEKI